ncbi:MAG: hypothetical protein MSJ26_06630 [Oscillospiraceae bacterium]|nr:hypothetical protein [Oscillospiraceae bacterium]
MIKGVNKRIVEVSFPESVYFEKAVVFLRAEGLPRPDSSLEDEARAQIIRLENGISPAPLSPAKIKARIAAGMIINWLFKLSVIICGGAALILLLE